MKKLALLLLFGLAMLIQPTTSSGQVTATHDSLTDSYYFNLATTNEDVRYYKLYWIPTSDFSVTADTVEDLPERVSYFKGPKIILRTTKHIPPDDVFYVRVKAYDNAKDLIDSSWIMTVNTPVLAAETYLTWAPTHLTDYINRGDLIFNWINGNGTDTKVYYKVSSDVSYTLLGTYANPIGTATLPDIVAGTIYKWYAVTVGGDGSEVQSAIKTVNAPLPSNRE